MIFNHFALILRIRKLTKSKLSSRWISANEGNLAFSAWTFEDSDTITPLFHMTYPSSRYLLFLLRTGKGRRWMLISIFYRTRRGLICYGKTSLLMLCMNTHWSAMLDLHSNKWPIARRSRNLQIHLYPLTYLSLNFQNNLQFHFRRDYKRWNLGLYFQKWFQTKW